ncbi:hypothetical protein PVK06_039960 [Gossypium arboreum]|uniref:DUF659 domain-containing protein n=1 Tax=Gossypium arboreum TaxID=29729 RepID=A0ABR0N477_GOSAR|nr:hypothetical protein PVK06_039960 [Gossypium arboreum]
MGRKTTSKTKVGKSVKGPSAYEMTEVYLEEEYKEIQEWVNAFKPIWEERGVTIMCDGWKGTRNQHIIIFLIYSPRAMDRAKLAIQRDCLYYKKYWEIIDTEEVINFIVIYILLIEEREDATLDSEQNFSWLPKELLNETNEETQGKDMNDISPAPSNEESVQLSTSSGDDGDDPGGNNEGAYQTTHGHIYSSNFHGDKSVTRYPYVADLDNLKVYYSVAVLRCYITASDSKSHDAIPSSHCGDLQNHYDATITLYCGRNLMPCSELESWLPGEHMQSPVRWSPSVHPLVKMNFDVGFKLGTLESRSVKALAYFQALSFVRDMDFHAMEVEGDWWAVLSKLVATKIDSSAVRWTVFSSFPMVRPHEESHVLL